MELETTTGQQYVLLGDVKIVKPVLRTRTPEFDSYDVVLNDGTMYEFFDSVVSRDYFCGLLPRDNPFSTKKLLGLF